MKLKPLSKFNYSVSIDAIALRKLMFVVKEYHLEFSAIMHAERNGNHFHAYDVFFPKQTNTSVHTEYDSDAEITLMEEGYNIVKGNGHAHSHVNMAVSPSGLDYSEIVDRAKTSGFNVSFILNKKGEIFCHVVDDLAGLYIEDIPVEVRYPFSKEDYNNFMMNSVKECTTFEEVKDLVKFTEKDYFNSIHPFTEEEKVELKAFINSRFNVKSPVVYTNYSKKEPYIMNKHTYHNLNSFSEEEYDPTYEIIKNNDNYVPTAKEVAEALKKNFNVKKSKENYEKLKDLQKSNKFPQL